MAGYYFHLTDGSDVLKLSSSTMRVIFEGMPSKDTIDTLNRA
jgi:hypothetical protein